MPRERGARPRSSQPGRPAPLHRSGRAWPGRTSSRTEGHLLRWGLGDLTELTDAPDAAGDPAAYLTDFDDTARVVYRGEDEHIH